MEGSCLDEDKVTHIWIEVVSNFFYFKLLAFRLSIAFKRLPVIIAMKVCLALRPYRRATFTATWKTVSPHPRPILIRTQLCLLPPLLSWLLVFS
jgi:hypothetical protein